MRNASLSAGVIASLALAVQAARAQAPVPIGVEVQVNTYATSDQSYPAVGMDSDGDFVVVWQSLDEDGLHQGIFARRFSASGIAQATPFQVNSYTTRSASPPAATASSHGRAMGRTATCPACSRGALARTDRR